MGRVDAACPPSVLSTQHVLGEHSGASDAHVSHYRDRHATPPFWEHCVYELRAREMDAGCRLSEFSQKPRCWANRDDIEEGRDLCIQGHRQGRWPQLDPEVSAQVQGTWASLAEGCIADITLRICKESSRVHAINDLQKRIAVLRGPVEAERLQAWDLELEPHLQLKSFNRRIQTLSQVHRSGLRLRGETETIRKASAMRVRVIPSDEVLGLHRQLRALTVLQQRLPIGRTWVAAMPRSIWMPRSGPAGIAMGCGRYPAGGVTAAVRSAPMQMPRSCCGRGTAISMATVMAKHANPCADWFAGGRGIGTPADHRQLKRGLFEVEGRPGRQPDPHPPTESGQGSPEPGRTAELRKRCDTHR